MIKSRRIGRVLLLVLAFITGSTYATPLPEFEEFAVGDKLTYQTRADGRSSSHTFTFSESNPAGVKGTVEIGGQKMTFEAPAHGYLGRELCLAQVMTCEWTPPVKMFDRTLKINDSWNATTVVNTGKKILVDEVLQSKVERADRVKVPAGEFDALLVLVSGTIKATTERGDVYKGTLKMRTWFGVVNKRLVLIKRDYENSFGDTFTQELAKLPELAQ